MFKFETWIHKNDQDKQCSFTCLVFYLVNYMENGKKSQITLLQIWELFYFKKKNIIFTIIFFWYFNNNSSKTDQWCFAKTFIIKGDLRVEKLRFDGCASFKCSVYLDKTTHLQQSYQLISNYVFVGGFFCYQFTMQYNYPYLI